MSHEILAGRCIAPSGALSNQLFHLSSARAASRLVAGLGVPAPNGTPSRPIVSLNGRTWNSWKKGQGEMGE